MSFKTIRETSSAIWPAVRTSLEINRAHRAATKDDPHATTSARRRAERPWNRVVAEETVWALAKQGFLVTPEQAAVVAAAQAWVRSWDGVVPDQSDPQEDVALYKAVQAFASALDGESLDTAAVG